jgi:DNA polymerase-3 subunit gamma/tau
VPTALYRRYRPETFADVIGQEHVTVPLMRALSTGRVNHAYLFSGPRGCGKTTSARILARCLNCEQGPTPTPCGTSDSCVGLSRGGAGTVDVVEIDAASHGGVDDARDLRERATFGPAVSRYRVYIIDEAHMVSSAGFNALLKIVEEPPEHMIFVFATTAPEKVIGTIRSRTHHYPFHLVPPAQLEAYMTTLCEQEGVTVEKGVLPLVVRAGGGSVRDSLSVLDQLIGGSDEGGLTYRGAIALLGYTDAALLDDVVEAFAAGDGAAVFRVVDRVVESGHEPRRFVEDLLERLRDLLVVSVVPDGANTVLRDRSEDQLERLRQQASRFGTAQLTRAAEVLNDGLTELTGATSPRLQLELVCARVLLPGADGEHGYAARLDRIERRLHAGTSSADATSAAPSAGVRPAVAGDGRDAPREATRAAAARTAGDGGSAAGLPADAGTAAARTADEAGAPRPEPATHHPEPPAAGAPDRAPAGAQDRAPAGGVVDVEVIRRVWPDVVERLAGMRRVTWMMVRDHATVASFDGRRLVLALGNPGVLANFRSGAHGEFVQQALIDVLGVEAQVDVVDAGSVASVASPAPAAAPRPEAAQPAAGRQEGEPTQRRDVPEESPHQPSAAPASAPAAEREPEPAGWDAPGAAEATTTGAATTGAATTGAATTARDEPAPVRRPRVSPADDVPSRDDVDAADSDLVGRAVVEQLLGGKVIDETDA